MYEYQVSDKVVSNLSLKESNPNCLHLTAGHRWVNIKNKKAHWLKLSPLKDFILGSSPSVSGKLLTHMLANVNTNPPIQNF